MHSRRSGVPEAAAVHVTVLGDVITVRACPPRQTCRCRTPSPSNRRVVPVVRETHDAPLADTIIVPLFPASDELIVQEGNTLEFNSRRHQGHGPVETVGRSQNRVGSRPRQMSFPNARPRSARLIQHARFLPDHAIGGK